MITLYRPGDSLVHRTPAGVKLLALMIAALAVALAPRTLWVPATLGALAAVLYLVAQLGLGEFARQWWAAKWLLLAIGVTLLIFDGWQPAAFAVLRVGAVLVLAALITLTTTTTAMLDALSRGLAPLRLIRINPDRVALTMSLALAAIPVIAAFARTIDEAQAARGTRRSIRAYAVPLLVMTLKHADELADAMTARGVE